MSSIDELVHAIQSAAKDAFEQLFKEHPGDYYYCTLITTGEAHPPYISAWSKEALDKALQNETDREEALSLLKWSHADSPYCDFGNTFFDQVKSLFNKRPQIKSSMTNDEWDEEYNIRLKAMESAMYQLDQEGLFGTGDTRNEVVVNVEVMPPDQTNTERAYRLNPPEALKEWLREAGEV